MPISFSIDPRANLVTVTCTGRITYHDLIAGLEERLQHLQYKPGMHILYDLRAASIDISLQEMKELVALLKTRQQERGTGFRFALVVSEVTTHGISELYRAYADELPEDSRVFWSMEGAKQWLRVED